MPARTEEQDEDLYNEIDAAIDRWRSDGDEIALQEAINSAIQRYS